MEIFRSLSRGFLLVSPVSLTKLCSFWYGLKDLFTLHKFSMVVLNFYIASIRETLHAVNVMTACDLARIQKDGGVHVLSTPSKK